MGRHTVRTAITYPVSKLPDRGALLLVSGYPIGLRLS
ncbi:hypothetical protein SAMN05880582_102182 [Rhizobium sp. RU20A]|nr:hypothetical protein SAMN05880582_102182 [Rhizobium sp. RU20A]